MVNNPPAKAGGSGWIPGSGRSPGGGNASPLQDSCLGNPMDRGAWRATVLVTGHTHVGRVVTRIKMWQFISSFSIMSPSPYFLLFFTYIPILATLRDAVFQGPLS